MATEDPLYPPFILEFFLGKGSNRVLLLLLFKTKHLEGGGGGVCQSIYPYFFSDLWHVVIIQLIFQNTDIK